MSVEPRTAQHPSDDDPASQTQASSYLASLTCSMLRFIYRAPHLVLILSLLITGLAAQQGYQLKDHLRTKIQALLPDHAPSVQASRSLSERLSSVDILVLTLMTEDFERVKLVLPKLKERLEKLPQIRAVQWRQDTSLIERNALITFPTLDELKEAHQELTDEIKRVVSKKMKLFDEEPEREQTEQGGEGQAPLSPRENFTSELVKGIQDREGRSYVWGELEGDESLSAIGARLRGLSSDYPEYFHNSVYSTIGLKIFPTQPSHDLSFCQELVSIVERESRAVVREELGEISPQGVVSRLDLGGAYVGVLNQSKKIKGDMFQSTVASLSLLALVIIIAFRSFRGLVCVLGPLIMGTVWTLGCTEILVGHLNLVTVFIFAVLLGLGIDFGIHFYGRFRDERAQGVDVLRAMERTHLSCGHASILAASTTSIAFLALTLADFRGLSQFGGIAALGVMLCLMAVFIVMPAIVFSWERWAPLKLMGYQLRSLSEDQAAPNRSWVNQLGGRVALVGLFVGIIGLGLSPHIERELNFNKLKAYPKPQVSSSPGEISASRLQYGTTKGTSPTVVFAQSPEEARLLQDQLSALADDLTSRVKSVQSLYSLIPTEQPQRIKWARKLCRKLKRKYKLFEGDARAGAEELLKRCNPTPFTEADLPLWVTDQFTDRQGVVGGFLFVSPRGSGYDGENALAFHAQMQTLKTLSGGPPVVAGRTMIWAEVLTAVQRDGALTFGVALLAVLIILGLLERSWIGLLFVSAPLVLGLGFTVGVMVIFEIKLNFFNLLALPTLIGMGVDDGVHMHHRYRELGPNSAAYIVRTTGRAAFLTTLTTSIGFASLMLADHRGLNSLGVLSVVGMSAALFATLVILPALFNWRDRRALLAVSLTALTLLFYGCDDAALSYQDPSATQRRDAQVTPLGEVDQSSAGERFTIGGESGGMSSGTPAGAGVSGGQSGGQTSGTQINPSGEETGGSTTPLACQTHCDCEQGLACVDGSCVTSTAPVYCCSRRPCPREAECQSVRGELLTCPAAPCQTACDCAAGFSCLNGECALGESLFYCCDSSQCPSERACESATGEQGMCPFKPGCAHTCDCPTGQRCDDGQCSIPSAMEPLVLCCERDCTSLTRGVSCEELSGERVSCP